MTHTLLLNHPAISDLAFYVNGSTIPDPVTVACDGAELACHYYEAKPGGSTVVFFHGNGESVSDYVRMLPGLFALVGCNTFLAEYRGYGGSTGVPNLGTLFPDCCRILERVPVGRDRMIFFGRSMGCIQAAAAAGLVPDARGLILESGLDDVYSYVVRSLTRYRGSPGVALGFASDEEPLERLRTEVDEHCNIPACLAGFRGCATVTYSLLDPSHQRVMSERVFGLLTCPKRIIRFDNADHNGALKSNIKTYCEQIRDMATGTFRGD
jgi:pimeloyl-ACP methyl ester carboxylesterase